MRARYLLLLGVLPFVLATRAPADECDPNDTTLLKPDLGNLTPARTRILNVGGHRILSFTSSIGNTGDGPLILHGRTVPGKECESEGSLPTKPCNTDADCAQGAFDETGPPSTCVDGHVTEATQEIWRKDGSVCSRVAGYFVWHPSHHHFHFQGFSSYELRKDDPYTGEIVAQSSKTSFCLLDIAQLTGYRNYYPQFVNDCLNTEGTYGISVGYADVYDFLLPGQSIDLDADPNNPVQPGNYYLVNTVNPDKNIWEIDDSVQSNSGYVLVSIGGGTGRVNTRPTHTVHQPTGPVMRPRSRFPHPPHSTHPTHPTHAPHPPHSPIH
jgi:hypothetical protein